MVAQGEGGFRGPQLDRDGAREEADTAPAVEVVLFNPIPRGRGSLRPPLSPGVLQRVGQPPKNPQNGCGVGLVDSALILPMRDVQGVMGSILDAPALLFQLQPLLFIELALGSRTRQPSPMEFAVNADAAIDSGDLQRSGQTEFLGFNRLGDDGPVFLTSPAINGFLQYRGEGPPAGVAGRF